MEVALPLASQDFLPILDCHDFSAGRKARREKSRNDGCFATIHDTTNNTIQPPPAPSGGGEVLCLQQNTMGTTLTQVIHTGQSIRKKKKKTLDRKTPSTIVGSEIYKGKR
jgi:hypothetical protein